MLAARVKVESLFQEVMQDLGHRKWKLRWTLTDAYCWRLDRIIDICLSGSLVRCEQTLLHEIAHIDVVESFGNQHTLRFWNHLQYLVQEYLGMGLDMHQTRMAEIYCPGFVG